MHNLHYVELEVPAALPVAGFADALVGVHFFLASPLVSNFAYVLVGLHSSHQVPFVVFSLFFVH